MNVELSTEQQAITFNEALAESLVHYAASNSAFSGRLSEMVKKLPTPHSKIAAFHPLTPLLAPTSPDTAEQQAQWLIGRAASTSTPESDRVRAILATAAHKKTRTAPKQIVVGILATSIPGVTAGRLPKVDAMTIVLNRELISSLTQQVLLAATNRASLDVVANALAEAQGSIKKLEPGLAAWLTGDRDLKFYEASPAALAGVADDLAQLSIPHATGHDTTGQAIALAITPAVNTTIQRLVWDIEPLGE